MGERTRAHSGELVMAQSISPKTLVPGEGGTGTTDSDMNFHTAAPKIPPRILCIGIPVRDLTFRVSGVPARGSKENATHFDEICGGNALNAAIGIVRLGGRASICGPMGDARETSTRFIFEKLAHEGIETKHIVHIPD